MRNHPVAEGTVNDMTSVGHEKVDNKSANEMNSDGREMEAGVSEMKCNATNDTEGKHMEDERHQPANNDTSVDSGNNIIGNESTKEDVTKSIIKPKTHTDIYGRTPGKEFKFTIACPNNCGRYMSSSKIAMHLEKCLGISTRKRSNNNVSGKQGKQAKRKSSNLL